MVVKHLALNQATAEAYVVPLKGVNLVFAKTEKGMIGCGAFDVKALDKFDYPAAKIAAEGGITTIDDLLSGTVRETNNAGKTLGITQGMGAADALKLLQ